MNISDIINEQYKYVWILQCANVNNLEGIVCIECRHMLKKYVLFSFSIMQKNSFCKHMVSANFFLNDSNEYNDYTYDLPLKPTMYNFFTNIPCEMDSNYVRKFPFLIPL